MIYPSFSKPFSLIVMGLVALIVAACGTSTPINPGATATTVAPVVTLANLTSVTPTVVAESTTTTSSPTPVSVEATVTLAPENTATPTAPVAVIKLNLNTVTAEELLNTIPGFGNRMVREFQEYRPYISIEQFRREIGKYVDDAQVAEYEKYVYVPITVNEADAATLQQIPGLEATEAAGLIAARPFASNAAFITALAAYVSADERVVAESYLVTP